VIGSAAGNGVAQVDVQRHRMNHIPARAVDATGHPVLAGYFYGTGNFGGSTLTSAGMADGFVTKLAP